MEPRAAMARLDGIYDLLARAAAFRGYRAATVLPGAALALVAASVQAAWIPRPAAVPGAWLGLWVGTAVVASLPPFGELWWRYRRSSSRLERELTLRTVGAMLPGFGCGAVLALMAAMGRSELLPLLPGLWALLFRQFSELLQLLGKNPALAEILDTHQIQLGKRLCRGDFLLRLLKSLFKLL